MNQDQVKEKLLKIHECKEDFAIIFTGKKSPKVNGLYKSEKNEILIHNRNFENNKVGDNLLMYTAIHELAHHIQFTEHKQKSVRAHTQLFYSIMDDLVDIAEKEKVYNIGIDDETQQLIDEVRNISCQIAKLQRELGETLIRLEGKCQENGIRFDDVIERKVQVSRKTVQQTIKAHKLNLPEDIGADIQEAAIKERDEDKRQLMINAAQEGKSIDQAKQINTVPVKHEDETVSLVKEKRRLEKTIVTLKTRLEEIQSQLESRGEL